MCCIAKFHPYLHLLYHRRPWIPTLRSSSPWRPIRLSRISPISGGTSFTLLLASVTTGSMIASKIPNLTLSFLIMTILSSPTSTPSSISTFGSRRRKKRTRGERKSWLRWRRWSGAYRMGERKLRYTSRRLRRSWRASEWVHAQSTSLARLPTRRWTRTESWQVRILLLCTLFILSVVQRMLAVFSLLKLGRWMMCLVCCCFWSVVLVRENCSFLFCKCKLNLI